MTPRVLAQIADLSGFLNWASATFVVFAGIVSLLLVGLRKPRRLLLPATLPLVLLPIAALCSEPTQSLLALLAQVICFFTLIAAVYIGSLKAINHLIAASRSGR